MGGIVDQITGGAGANAANQAGQTQGNAYINASNEQTNWLQKAIDELSGGYDQTRQNYQPYLDMGLQGFQQYAAGTGALGRDAQEQAYRDYAVSPGQKYLQQQAQNSILANASAGGGLNAPGVLQALQQSAIDMSSLDWNNHQAQLSGLGQTGFEGVGQMGQFQQNTSNSIANTLGQIRQARASGIIGQGQALAGGIIGSQQARGAGMQNIMDIGGALAGGLF